MINLINICRFCLVFLIGVCFSLPCHAIDSNAGTGGGVFMKLGIGNARALSLGRAYVALAEGPDALVWNPAGIAASQQREISFAILKWVQDFNGKYVGYVQPFGRSVVGVSVAYFTMEGFDARDEDGVPMDSSNIVVRDGFATLSVARSFFLERLFLGASIKGVREDLAGTKYQSVVGDLGVIFRPNPRFSFGGAIQNYFGDKTEVVQTQRIGAAFNLSDFVNISVEVSQDSDNHSRAGAGLELILPEELLEVGEVVFRGGYYDADALGQSFDSTLKNLGLDKASGFAFGIGIYSSHLFGAGVGFDYALVPFGALGLVNQMCLKIRF